MAVSTHCARVDSFGNQPEKVSVDGRRVQVEGFEGVGARVGQFVGLTRLDEQKSPGPQLDFTPGHHASAYCAGDGFSTVTPSGSPERSLRAASYALSPVAGSGVSSNLQVSEDLTGGTRLTLSLTGIDTGGNYVVILYQGDCGPDRDEVARLKNVNAADGNPNSSVSDSPLGFEAITGADHFLYVLSEPGDRDLACGEVGLGANP